MAQRTSSCSQFLLLLLLCLCCWVVSDVAARTSRSAKHPNERLLPQDKCGTSSPVGQTTDPNKVRLLEYPSIAALKYKSSTGTKVRCGGTLINKRYVLTSAHCIHNETNFELVGLTLGEYDLTKEHPVQDFVVSSSDAIVHPNYRKSKYEDDIALIRLPSDVNAESKIDPVCLPIRDDARNNKFAHNLTLVGWLSLEKGGDADLLKVSVPVVPHDRCVEVFKGKAVISDKQLCAGDTDSKDACARHGGSPLVDRVKIDGVERTVQYGVMSFGTQDCKLDFPRVYTRIGSYVDWILDNLKE